MATKKVLVLGGNLPARAARRPHQGPVALTTRSASTWPSRPVRWPRKGHPGRAAGLDPQANGLGERPQLSLPFRRAVAKNRSGSRIASIGGVRDSHRRLEGRVEPRLQLKGLGRGQLPGRDTAGRAGGQEPPSRQSMSSSLSATNNPPFSSNEPGAIRRRMRFLYCTPPPTPGRPRRSAPPVQQPLVAAGGARGQLALLDQRHPQPAQHQVVGERPHPCRLLPQR